MLDRTGRSRYRLIDLNSAFGDLRLVVPSVQELANCASAKDVANLPQPGEN